MDRKVIRKRKWIEELAERENEETSRVRKWI